MQRIRLGSLMIRVLAVFFGLLTAYATYQHVGREPICVHPASAEAPGLETAAAGPEIIQGPIGAPTPQPPSP